MRLLRLALFALGFWLVHPSPLSAQAIGGSLQGLITDASGGAVQGAHVVVLNSAIGEARELKTDASGRYHVPILPPGDYEIRVTAAGDLKNPTDPSEYIGYLRGWFATTWRYRFVQRDSAALFEMAPALRERAAAMIADAEAASRRVLTQVVDAGLLTVELDMLETLLANVWIVSSHWIDHLALRQHARELGPADLDWGFRQVLALFLPYLSEELRGWMSSPAAPFASISEARV